MSKTAQVVDGEASESDSEIEIGRSPELEIPANTETFVIAGEAPESDDESKIQSPQTPDSDLPFQATRPLIFPSKLLYGSILHQRLWECNVSLRATVEGMVKQTTEISVEKLARVDKLLLNIQESMRASIANLTQAKARLRQINAQLQKISCGTALPTVKVKT